MSASSPLIPDQEPYLSRNAIIAIVIAIVLIVVVFIIAFVINDPLETSINKRRRKLDELSAKVDESSKKV